MTLANFSTKTPAIYRLLLLTVAGATFLGGCSQLPRASSSPQESIAPPTSTPTPSNLGNATSRSLPVRDDTDSNFVVAAVDKVGPAVVRIDSARTVRRQAPGDEYNDPFFRRFFGGDAPVPPAERTVRGTGSGFVINAEGKFSPMLM